MKKKNLGLEFMAPGSLDTAVFLVIVLLLRACK
jgi:hypothetical protein